MNLLERDACLQSLDAALRDASEGMGRVALVSGEAGIGKTALVERFSQKHQGVVRTLWGVCDALFSPRPLGPLYDIAAQVQSRLPALLDAEASRSTIFSSVLRELQERPVLVVFEDVHWADEATLDLIRFLGRRIARTMALLVITYRDDELGLRHPLRTVLGDLAASSIVRRIPIPRLTEQAVRTLICNRAINATDLYHQTHGNPFFVTEVLSSPGDGLPPTIRDAVLARTARLSAAAQGVLQAAAVIGQRIEPWLLKQISGAEVQAIDECLANGMLVTQGDVLIFRHEMARQAVLELNSPSQTIALHRMNLVALKTAQPTRNDLARLAHHAEAAGDREAVQEYAPAAARLAGAASAPRTAAALYELALRFVDDDLPGGKHAMLLESYAEQCDYIGKQSEGIAARRRAVELWRGQGNALKQGENLAHLMYMLNRTGQNAEAERVSQASIEILEALPPGRELALAYRTKAGICLVNRDCEEALNWAEKALVLAERLKDTEVLVATHVTIGTAWLFLDYGRGRSYLEHSLAIAGDAMLEGRVAHLYTNLGSGSAELYHFHNAARYLELGIAYAAERDFDNYRLYMQAWQALTNVYLGQWREAVDIATSVLQCPGLTVISRITALVALGRAGTRRGDPGAAAALDEALELAVRAGNLQRLGPVRAARAEAAWLTGDYQRTLEEARAVYDLAVCKQHPWLAGELAFWLQRAGEDNMYPEWLAQPFILQISGNWRAAADEWQRLGCPYEQARALADGDDRAQLVALGSFDRLGAQPAADALRRKMRTEGILHIPRGPRPATREHPFGLTVREVEILALLVEDMTNAGIAARLDLSAKTVDHHVSAVLSKLQVHSRKAAAALARRTFLLDPN